MTETLIYAYRSLMRKKTRTILSAMAISIGVTAVIVILAISSTGSQRINDELDSLGLDGITIGKNVNNTSSAIGKSEYEVVAANANVEKATPIIYFYSSVAECDNYNESTSCIAWGIPEDADEAVSIEIIHGRMISSQDISEKRNVCLIDAATANNIFGKENAVGESVMLMSNGKPIKCKIIGIVRTGSGILQNMLGNFIPTFVYMPLTFTEKIENRTDYDRITVKLRNDNKSGIDSICDGINDQLINALDNENKDITSYSITNMANQRESLMSIMSIIKIILTAISAISLIVAGIGIMTVMTVSVNERTHEIGIRKAIGASRMCIMIEFMTEALLLSITGCVFGIIISLAIGAICYKVFGFILLFDFISIAYVVFFAAAIGIFFGIFPAYKAACLKPIEALRES